MLCKQWNLDSHNTSRLHMLSVHLKYLRKPLSYIYILIWDIQEIQACYYSRKYKPVSQRHSCHSTVPSCTGSMFPGHSSHRKHQLSIDPHFWITRSNMQCMFISRDISKASFWRLRYFSKPLPHTVCQYTYPESDAKQKIPSQALKTILRRTAFLSPAHRSTSPQHTQVNLLSP